ncbi:hypothetical protein IFM12275_00110 [Nocardia sputorum]|uniref:Uncharacterized protein n=1 Tax=Nocardia sputorum TaxID=2984338 RepID=A0ABN6U0B0_9NOCA|nr:hypothetical protein IFM12275_00110 [Nocardia sputorum]BDT98659.1 hypothetical protein IFM12276_16880 [Nocardia sputorum]
MFDGRRAGRRAGARLRGVAVALGAAARGVAARDRAVVVLPRADPARARVVVVLRDLPAMAPG